MKRKSILVSVIITLILSVSNTWAATVYTIIDLGTLGGDESRALDINNKNHVVGYSKNNNGHYRAFLWENGSITDLDGTPGHQSTARCINNSAQIVGTMRGGHPPNRAFLYENGSMIDLGTLGGSESYARAINDSGQVVGHSTTDSSWSMFLWENGSMIDLGIGSGTSYDINNKGQIVGYTSGSGAFLWENGSIVVLNMVLAPGSGWNIKGAMSINDNGWIVGWGTNPNGQSHAYLLVPEPAPTIEVAIDIKPGSCPNPLNVKSKGVLPVAILGLEDFDVNTIDVASIRLADVAPIRHSFEDVAAPVLDTNDCNCTTDGPDGFIDLTLKFKTQEIVEAIGEVNHGDEFMLTLTGVLSDETPIEGADCILVRGKFKPCNKADINKDGIVDTADFSITSFTKKTYGNSQKEH